MKKLLCVVVATAGLGMSGFASAGNCKDPWVTQAVKEVLKRSPNGSGNTGECDIQRYGNGHWSSYNDLVSKVRAANGFGIAQGSVRPGGAAAAPVGTFNRNGGQVVSAGGANVVSAGGANVVSAGGANAVPGGR